MQIKGQLLYLMKNTEKSDGCLSEKVIGYTGYTGNSPKCILF